MRFSGRYIAILAGTLIWPALYLDAQPSVYKTERLSFSNPLFNDIAPVIVKDGILFCSDRRNSSAANITTFEDERLYNLYFAGRRDSVRWKQPVAVKTTASDMLFCGPVTVAADGKTIYFTSSVITGKAARKRNIKNRLGIYSGTLEGNILSNIKPFEYNSTDYSVAHPSLSRDGKYLFFASDMPGGQGGSDIYYCEFINGKWGQPKNMGARVNSSSKENYPFIHPSGRLYFSSDRPESAAGLGGMNIFYTSLVFGEWDDPVLMPEPINSASDDFSFVVTDDLKEGFFTRKTGRDDDIWRMSSAIIRKQDCPPSVPDVFCFEFFDENAVKFDTMPVPFRFKWNFGDGETGEGVTVQHCFKNPGTYVVRLDIVNLLTNEVEQNQKSYTLEIERNEQAYISGPDRCFEGEKVVFDADSTWLPGWSINQYYWNFDDESIAIGTKVEKIFSRPGNYNIQLIVSSAPDAGGRTKETCVSKNVAVIRKQ